MPAATPQDPAAIARAFQMAAHLPGEERVRLRVHVLSSDGVLLAGGILRGFEQAAFLRDQLQNLGFFECLPVGAARAWGCDILLRQAALDVEGPRGLLRGPPRSWPAVVRHVRGRGTAARR